MAASSSSSTGYEVPVSFDALLASLPPQEKINFLAACRLIYDNATLVLREVCIRESGGNVKLPLPTENKLGVEVGLKDNEFTALVDHLLYKRRTAAEQCGSFFKKASCKFTTIYKATNKGETKCLELTPQTPDNSSFTLAVGGKVQIPSEKKNPNFSLEEIEGSRYCIAFQKSIKVDTPVDVYLPTEAWYSINDVRTMRNICIGHACAANLTNDALKDMFRRIRAAYEKLGVHELSIAEEVYKKLGDIETSCKDWSEGHVKLSALMNYKQRVEKYWQELATLNDRVGVLERRCDAMETESGATKDRVCALETRSHVMQEMLAASNHDIQGRLGTLEGEVAAGKDCVDGIKDDLQSLRKNTEDRFSNLEARGSGPPIVCNYFGGQGNTVYLQQNLGVYPQHTGGYAGPSRQPGAAAQQYSYTPPQRPQLPSSQFASGPPTQDEITRLSTAIIQSPSYQLKRTTLSKIGKTLGMEEDVVARIQSDSSQPYAQVSNLLTQWVEKSPNNSRDQLYELLCNVSLSSPALSVLHKQ